MNQTPRSQTGLQTNKDEARQILDRIADRRSCRVFDGTPIDPDVLREIVADGTQAPSSCNQQMWHFVILTDRADLARANEIAGGNPHFSDCSALIYLCFQKGWAHDNHSVVQSVAAATYHMMISAHLRGLSSIWNAGIGDHQPLREMMGIPAVFELVGALAVGRPTEGAPLIKAPRRDPETILSFGRFARPGQTIYPARAAESYPYAAISKARNPYAEWNPQAWSWDQLADFRGYSVWAKSPTAGVYQSRRQGEAAAAELSLLPALPPNARVAELLPWGGTTTAALRGHLPQDAHLDVVELAEASVRFVRERLNQEGLGHLPTDFVLMRDGRLPHSDASLDAVVFLQSLEHMRDRAEVLAEARRVLKPGGALVVSARNMTSRYGRTWRQVESLGQVPLQGPFTPIPARALRDLVIGAGFDIQADAGIGLDAGGDAALGAGPMRARRRLIALRARPRA